MAISHLMFSIAVLQCIVYITKASEPRHCTEFSLQEKLLEKVIRQEVSFENMVDNVKTMEESVTNGLTSLRDERTKLVQEVETAEKNHLQALNEKLRELEDFMKRVGEQTEEKLDALGKAVADRLAGLGAVYTRWGRTTCPNESIPLYAGIAAGSDHSQKGGPVETICLPKDPQWSRFDPSTQAPFIYGTEYEGHGTPQMNAVFGKDLLNDDVPCVVCKSTGRPSMMLVPARTECYSGWFLEYTGYLMATHNTQHTTNIKCVDAEPEVVEGRGGNENGDLLYFIEATGNLPDPPYIRGRELTCAVCTQ